VPKKFQFVFFACVFFLGSAAAESEIPVSPDDLLAAYKSNEVAADMEYQGKPLSLVGAVKKISKNMWGQIIIEFSTSNQFVSVNARINKGNEQQAAQTKIGERIRLHCIGQGMTLGFPFVGKCHF
jgi:hypothetical protein